MRRCSRPLNGIGAALLLIGLWGCAMLADTPLPSTPFFTAEQGDAKMFQAVARKQEALANKCVEHNACDHVYFTRALVALFESREAAAKYFHKVIAVAPKSRQAASSALWIRLLQETPNPVDQSWVKSVLTAPSLVEHNAALAQTAERLVRDLLDREVAIQQLLVMKEADTSSVESLQRELSERDRRMEAMINKRDIPKLGGADTLTLQTLQRQINERDKKIEELTNQLEALKRIDQEMREKTRPIRPPTSVLPAPGTDTRP
ncbi:MAG: hypothetical protein AB1555_09875 [Nitrospirota bacterium]